MVIISKVVGPVDKVGKTLHKFSVKKVCCGKGGMEVLLRSNRKFELSVCQKGMHEVTTKSNNFSGSA